MRFNKIENLFSYIAFYPSLGTNEVMSIFLYTSYSDILNVRMLNVTNCNWVEQSYPHYPFNLRDTIGSIYSFILCCV